MKIIVPIKQVPETSNVKMDEETGTMIRDGIESIINPLDLYAIEAAIRLKEQFLSEITVISMGPGKAIEAIKEAIAMGCDNGVLLSDRKFAGNSRDSLLFIPGDGGFMEIVMNQNDAHKFLNISLEDDIEIVLEELENLH